MMGFTHRRRTLAFSGGALALGMLLTACGANDPNRSVNAGPGDSSPTASPTGTPASGPHNDADVAFAAGMVPHHGQAIAMAELARTRASDPAVKELAADITAAQGPEIAQLSGWLAGWGEDVPDADSMSMGMDHGGGHGAESSGMAGMMSTEQMEQLAASSGASFDRMWLTGMIAHHEGAIAMAKAELDGGANPEAKQLARAIIAAQQAEIATMRGLLAG